MPLRFPFSLATNCGSILVHRRTSIADTPASEDRHSGGGDSWASKMKPADAIVYMTYISIEPKRGVHYGT